jgi:predicted NBD/HSP70 family sugar kinase
MKAGRGSLILNHIFGNPNVSRKEMVSALGLHANLISDAVRELIDEEWVVEGGLKKGDAGRSTISLRLHPSKRVALSVCYSSHHLSCALVNADGQVLQEATVKHQVTDPKKLVGLIVQTAKQVSSGHSGTIIGMGVADPGMVDTEKGVVVRSGSFSVWREVPMQKLLEEELHFPVVVEDMSRTRAIAQYRNLAVPTQEKATMLYLDYGNDGVGFTFVTWEGIWRGKGLAGEVGHVVLEANGSLCRCGASGCLESLVGTSAAQSRIKEMLAQGVNTVLQGKDPLTLEAVFQAALDGDRLAMGVVRTIASSLGVTLSILVAALHPDYLVIGAEAEGTIRGLAKELQADIQNRVLAEIASSIKIVEGKPFGSVSLVGAGLMIFEEIIRRENRATVSSNANPESHRQG